MKRLLILLFSFLFLTLSSFGETKRNIKELFKNNEAIIYTINIRNFGAIDYDNDGLINNNDQKGTFLNAIDRLKELKEEGINTIYVLPITPVGKLKALGTAGSLYSMDSFNSINEQLKDENSSLTLFEQAKKFVDEAHNLGLNVIVDLPACGSYDLSLRKPNWFIEDKNLIPSDWTDVRLFKIYNEDLSLNETIIENLKQYFDMIISLGFDGVRIDVASIKPKELYEVIIKYARSKDKNFLFLAEANPTWGNPVGKALKRYTTVDELLEAGFDSYYGSWANFKDIKSKKEFDKLIKENFKILKKHKNTSIISALATHDQKAPILSGENYHKSVLWLSTTFPQNTYFLDGFKTADDFIYDYENKKANHTLTDDNQYFVHSGQFDIFNMTAQTRLKKPELKQDYLKAIEFKQRNIDLINKGKFKLLKTNNEKVYGYSISNNEQELIVIGSIDNKNNQKACVKSKYIAKDSVVLNVEGSNYQYLKNKIITELKPNEIKVILIGLSFYRAM